MMPNARNISQENEDFKQIIKNVKNQIDSLSDIYIDFMYCRQDQKE